MISSNRCLRRVNEVRQQPEPSLRRMNEVRKQLEHSLRRVNEVPTNKNDSQYNIVSANQNCGVIPVK
jgi:hypothetical protein